MRDLRAGAVLVAAGAALLSIAGAAAAQKAEPDPEKLWTELQEADYRSWKAFPGTADDFYKGGRPHGFLIRTWANETAARSPEELPPGSVIVKENYTAEKELVAITVMKRVSGYAPDSNDWYWVKYEPGGAVSSQEGTALAGRVGSCIGCHASAVGEDYVYTNDE